MYSIIDLYNALKDNDSEKAVNAYKQWGFKDISKAKLNVLNKWANFVYSPLMKDKVQKIQEKTSGVYGAKVASEVHRELRKLGGVQPPREFVFIDRAAIGMGSLFMRLDVRLNWHQLFHKLIDNFELNKIKKKQREVLLQ